MSVQGNVAALVDGETRHAWQENEKNMVYFENRSGGTRVSGQVVVRDPAAGEGLTCTTTVGDLKVLGVIPQIDDAGGNAVAQAIAAGARGYVQFAGKVGAVDMSGTTAAGDYLIASATAGKADAVAVYREGVFGVATSACVGAGTVSAILFPVQYGVADHTRLSNKGTNTHAQIDTAVANSANHMAAAAAVHGLPASVSALGNRLAAGGYIQYGQATPSGGEVAVTFPNAFAAVSCVVVTPVAAGPKSTAVSAVTAAGFTLRCSSDDPCYWLALGT